MGTKARGDNWAWPPAAFIATLSSSLGSIDCVFAVLFSFSCFLAAFFALLVS